MKEYDDTSNLPLDDRAEAYSKSGDMVAAIARRHAHVDIDELTQARWCQLMGLMREVDTWADDTDATPVDVMEGLASFDLFRERYPDLAPDVLDGSAQEAIAYRTIRVLKLGERVAQATTVKRYVALRIIEARESVNLFADTATEQVRQQPAFDTKLMPTLRTLGEAAALWDSIIDGQKDFHTDKQALKPDTEYYARLIGAMLRRGIPGSMAMMHIEPNVHLGIKVAKRVTNRIRNGVPEYSSLRVFSRGRKS